VIKISIKEVNTTLHEVNSIRKQAHFLNLSGLLNNLSRFIQSYCGKYESIETRIRNTSKMLFQEVGIFLKNYGIEFELLSDSGVKTKSNISPRTILKVNDPNSLGFVLKVVDGRMIVKVNGIESKEKLEAFVLDKENISYFENHHFDDLSNFVSVKTAYLKTLGQRENELKKSLKIWKDFKPSEWENSFKKTNLEKSISVVSTALAVASSFEKFHGKANNFDIGIVKEFNLDADVKYGAKKKKGKESLFLIPVGTILGTTVKEGIKVLENGNEFRRKKAYLNHYDNLMIEKTKDISNCAGSAINRVFW
jgi:hypothetical protein